MKTFITARSLQAVSIFFVLSSLLHAQDPVPSDIYRKASIRMDVISPPLFPGNTENIVNFGAKGDGIYDNTKAISDAIESVSRKGGGTVIVPEGMWFTGPIVFKSNINLRLESGAFVLFTPRKESYPVVETSFEGLDTRRCQSPVSGRNLENIAITGEGVIDGNGDAWRHVKKEKLTESQWRNLVKSGGVLNEKGTEWYPSEGYRKGMRMKADQNLPAAKSEEEWNSIRDFLRPVMVSFINCRNILLSGVTFQNSPAWCIHPLMCENVIISGITVRNPWYSQNGDGVDLESCRNAVIYKCSFDVGDDAICMKSGKNEAGRKRGIPCENVIVSECTVYHGHGGFTIGSEMSGGIRNFDVSNCLFIGTDVGLRFKSTRGRGGVVENIYIRDINMFRIPNEAIFFDLYYGGKAPGESKGNEQSGERSSIPTVTEETPCFRNIYMKNVVCNGAGKAMYFNGLPEMPLSNISVENSVISATSGVEIRESEKVTLKNVIINSRNSPAVMLFNCKDLTMNGLMSSQGDAGILKIDGARSSAITIINSGFSREKIENSLCEGIVRIK